jgi:uncharacterized protein
MRRVFRLYTTLVPQCVGVFFIPQQLKMTVLLMWVIFKYIFKYNLFLSCYVMKKYWYDNDAVVSSVFNASSIIVPVLEEFVAETVSKAKSEIADVTLKRDADILLHEERAHVKVHNRYNDILTEKGYRFERVIYFEKAFLRFFRKRADLKTRLALCLCGEYFTSLMSKHSLEEGIFILHNGIDEHVRKIWIWHSLEELHHRSIAFDVYQHLGGGYVRRCLIMFVASTFFLFVHTWCFLSLLRQDKKIWSLNVLKDSFLFQFGIRGYYGSVLRHWVSFFMPHFHPSQLPIKDRLRKLHHLHVEDKLITGLQ